MRALQYDSCRKEVSGDGHRGIHIVLPSEPWIAAHGFTQAPLPLTSTQCGKSALFLKKHTYACTWQLCFSRPLGLALRRPRSCLFRCRREMLAGGWHLRLFRLFSVASLQLAPVILLFAFFSAFFLCILTSQCGACLNSSVLPRDILAVALVCALLYSDARCG